MKRAIRHLDPKLKYQLQQRRHIWPVIAAGAAGVALHYAYRALKRMEEDKTEGKKDNAPNQSSINSGNAVGIDIGSTYARLSLASTDAPSPIVIENREGSRSTRSSIYSRQGLDTLFEQFRRQDFGSFGEDILVGSQAHKVRYLKPNLTLSGDDFTLTHSLQQDAAKSKAKKPLSAAERAAAYAIIARDLVEVAHTRPEIAASAPAFVTVPNHFSTAESSLVLSACNAGGFRCAAAIPDAVASVVGSVANGSLDLSPSSQIKDQKIAVVDIGGALTQLSIVQLSIADSVHHSESTSLPIILQEKTLLSCGGNSFDAAIAGYLAKEFGKTYGTSINIMDDPTAKSRVFDAAEGAKIDLSNSVTTTVNIPFLTADQTGPKHLNCDISRAQLEKILSQHLETIEQSLQELIAPNSPIGAVLMVGGGARMHILKNRFQKVLRNTPLVLSSQPEEVNAIGASYAWKLINRM